MEETINKSEINITDKDVRIDNSNAIVLLVDNFIDDLGVENTFLDTEEKLLNYFIETSKSESSRFSSWVNDRISSVGNISLLPLTSFVFDFGKYSKYMTAIMIERCEREIFTQVKNNIGKNISCYNYVIHPINEQGAKEMNMKYTYEHIEINQDLAFNNAPDPKDRKMINKLAVLTLNILNKYKLATNIIKSPLNFNYMDKIWESTLYKSENFQTAGEKAIALQKGEKVSLFTKEDFIGLSRDQMFYELGFKISEDSINKSIYSTGSIDCADWYNCVLIMNMIWNITSYYYLNNEDFKREYPDITYRKFTDVNIISKNNSFNPQVYVMSQSQQLGELIGLYFEKTKNTFPTTAEELKILTQLRKEYIDSLYPDDSILLSTFIPYGDIINFSNPALSKSLNDAKISETQRELLEAQFNTVGDGLQFDSDKFLICKVINHTDEGLVVIINKVLNYSSAKTTYPVLIPYNLIINLDSYKPTLNHKIKTPIYSYNVAIPHKSPRPKGTVNNHDKNALSKTPRQQVYLTYLLDVMFKQAVIMPLFSDIKMKYYMSTSNSNIRISKII